MTEPKKLIEVFLISTKNVEELNSENKNPILLNKKNSYPKSIFEIENSKKLTLKHFYHDIFSEIDRDTYIYNSNNNKEINSSDVMKVSESKLKENKEPSTKFFQFIHILNQNEEKVVFLTRCYPNTFEVSKKIKGDIKWNMYWLFAYMQTVASILEKEMNELSFNFLLHDEDIGERNKFHTFLNKKEPFEKPKLNFDKFWNVFKNESDWKNSINNIYVYCHDPNDYYYNNIILKHDFFNEVENPIEHLKTKLDPEAIEKNIDNINKIINSRQNKSDYSFKQIDFDLPLFKNQ